MSTQDVLNRFVTALDGALKLIADFGGEQLRSLDWLRDSTAFIGARTELLRIRPTRRGSMADRF